MIRKTALFAALLAGPVIALAAPPNLTGVWSIVSAPSTLKTAEGATPPLTAEGKKLYDEHQKALAKGDRASFDETTICLPPGLPRLMLVNKPFELIQREKAVYFVHQDNRMPRHRGGVEEFGGGGRDDAPHAEKCPPSLSERDGPA